MHPVQHYPSRPTEAAVMVSPADGPSWESLESYLALFREGFRRRDQLRWACVYLQGLLSEAERKTVGTMARQLVLPPELVVDDLAQALQNFVNQSPWDEATIWRRFRAEFRAERADDDGVFILDELAFFKQGSHSVGVQRQYSNLFGRKTNCQVAIGIWHANRDGLFPLALRLYLPRAWLVDPARLNATGVPEEQRAPRDKSQIALELLDEVRAQGWHAPAVLSLTPSASNADFRTALAERGLTYLLDWTPDQRAVETDAPVQLDRDTALTTNRPEEPRLGQWWSVREQLPEFRKLLLQDLGLDHFEGRSWRGFHHHACLVALAFGFRLREEAF